MVRVQRKGYTKRTGLETKRLMTDVGVSLMFKLDRIAEISNISKSQALNDILREGIFEYRTGMSWSEATQESAEKSAFIESYLDVHKAEYPDEITAMSAALDAYHHEKGYQFDTDEDTFLSPEEVFNHE